MTGLIRTVVAFANTAGGTILVGVEDGTGHVRGITDPLALEERLASALSDSIAPRLMPDIEVLPWRHTNVLAVHVYPSPSRPHHLAADGVDHSTYVRVGSTNRRADSALVAELRRFSLGTSFDELAMPELDSEALDFRAASECFAPIRKLKKSDLETLRLLVLHQGRLVPSIGGILLFGRHREAHFREAWIQAGRFDGVDKTRIADTASMHGPLPTLIEAAIEFVSKHSLYRFDLVGTARNKASWSLPPVAIREAIVNAVVHADYSQHGAPIRVAIFDDRVEVENPGLLPPGLTVEDLRRGVSKLRNRVIGRVFQELGLIEHWGSGIQRMDSACRDAGLPAPDLEEVGTRFRVTLRTGRVQMTAQDALDQSILAMLNDGDGLSTREIAARIDRTPRATRTRLISLIDRGFVREIGSSPQDPKRRYFKTRTS